MKVIDNRIKMQLRKESKADLIKRLDWEYSIILNYMKLIEEVNKVISSTKSLEEKIKEIDAILHPEVKTEVK